MNKKPYIVIILFLISTILFAQQTTNTEPQKFALVIGNGAYTNFGTLRNPVNDADAMVVALRSLGFTVDRVINASRREMENAAIRLRNQLSENRNSYGFFFYAGHGVQWNGINYLIPVDANIPDSDFLPDRAISLQTILDMLGRANNALNIVVLDACRDLPAVWSRTIDRGLAPVSRPPTDSIIMYATGAGRTASDGTGRNGLFTSHLLRHLTTPDIEVNEIFRRTMVDVANASNNEQRPAIYTDFGQTAYLGTRPDSANAHQPTPLPFPAPAQTNRDRENNSNLWSIGASIGTSFETPWVIGSIYGTIAPFRNQFLEIGIDYGMISSSADAESYYTVYPFIHYALFIPFENSGGWYAGAGCGYMLGEYTFPEGKIPVNIFAFDFILGVNLFNMINISYTLRTNFETANNKFSIGYVYRF